MSRDFPLNQFFFLLLNWEESIISVNQEQPSYSSFLFCKTPIKTTYLGCYSTQFYVHIYLCIILTFWDHYYVFYNTAF
jgi:hypothetical protein